MAKEGKKKKTWLWILIVVVLLVAGFLLWWFLRKFEVTLKYNNGDSEEVVYVRYINHLRKEDVKQDLTRDGYEFAGYHETYYLDGKQISEIKADSKKEETICKEGFKLDSEKTKCVQEEEFDFENSRIKKDTIIEALWTKKAEETSVKITSSANCAIGTNAVTLTAKITGKAKVKEWEVPSCYTDTKVNDKSIKITRNGNCPNEVGSQTVKVKLDNGKTASYTVKYEPKLDVKGYFLYGGQPNTPVSPYNGRYEANELRSNIKATFTGNPKSAVVSTTDTSARLNNNSSSTITIKTACGQSKTMDIAAIIN